MPTAAANTEPLPPIRARGIVQPITEEVTRNVDEQIRRRVTADRTTGSEDDDRSRRQRDYGDDAPRRRWGFGEYVALLVVIVAALWVVNGIVNKGWLNRPVGSVTSPGVFGGGPTDCVMVKPFKGQAGYTWSDGYCHNLPRSYE